MTFEPNEASMDESNDETSTDDSFNENSTDESFEEFFIVDPFAKIPSKFKIKGKDEKSKSLMASQVFKPKQKYPEKIITHKIEKKKVYYLFKFRFTSYRDTKWIATPENERMKFFISEYNERNLQPIGEPYFPQEYIKPDYILDKYVGEDCDESEAYYRVVWKGLPVEQATWEKREDYLEEAIKDYEYVPSKRKIFNKRRPELPNFRGHSVDEFRKYLINITGEETDGLNWFNYYWCANKNILLSNGEEELVVKTTNYFLEYINKAQHQYGPFLIIVPIKQIEKWRKTLQRDTTLSVLILTGATEQHSTLIKFRLKYRNTNLYRYNVVIIAHHVLRCCYKEIMNTKWRIIILDASIYVKKTCSHIFEIASQLKTEFKITLFSWKLYFIPKYIYTYFHYTFPNKYNNEKELIKNFNRVYLDGDLDFGKGRKTIRINYKAIDLNLDFKAKENLVLVNETKEAKGKLSDYWSQQNAARFLFFMRAYGFSSFSKFNKDAELLNPGIVSYFLKIMIETQGVNINYFPVIVRFINKCPLKYVVSFSTVRKEKLREFLMCNVIENLRVIQTAEVLNQVAGDVDTPEEIPVPFIISSKPFWDFREDQRLLFYINQKGITSNDVGDFFKPPLNQMYRKRAYLISNEFIELYMIHMRKTGENLDINPSTAKHVCRYITRREAKHIIYRLKNFDSNNITEFVDGISANRQHKYLKHYIKKALEECEKIYYNPDYNYYGFLAILPEVVSRKDIIEIIKCRETYKLIMQGLINNVIHGRAKSAVLAIFQYGFHKATKLDAVQKFARNIHKASVEDVQAKLKKICSIKKSTEVNCPLPDFPCKLTDSLILVSMGRIEYTNSNYFTSKYIYCPGYISEKLFFSTEDPSKQVWYRSLILEEEDHPLFRVEMKSDPSISFEGNSPSIPWNALLKAVENKKKELGMPPSRNVICSGPENLGLTLPVVTRFIKKLKDYKKLKKAIRNAHKNRESSDSDSYEKDNDSYNLLIQKKNDYLAERARIEEQRNKKEEEKALEPEPVEEDKNVTEDNKIIESYDDGYKRVEDNEFDDIPDNENKTVDQQSTDNKDNKEAIDHEIFDFTSDTDMLSTISEVIEGSDDESHLPSNQVPEEHQPEVQGQPNETRESAEEIIVEGNSKEDLPAILGQEKEASDVSSDEDLPINVDEDEQKSLDIIRKIYSGESEPQNMSIEEASPNMHIEGNKDAVNKEENNLLKFNFKQLMENKKLAEIKEEIDKENDEQDDQ